MGGATSETKESFAMFYSYATRHYAYKNDFGFTTPQLIWAEDDNFDVASFTTPKYSNWFSYPAYAKWASYLWELFDGHPTFGLFSGDNDDIAYPNRVISTWKSIRNITDFHSSFKNGLTAEEKNSVDGIYNFTVNKQTTGMRSQNFNSSSMSTSFNYLNVNFTYRPYGMADFTTEPIRNSPTDFRIYWQRFTNCPWELIGQIPYNVFQTNYSQSFNVGPTPTLYNYKMTVNNASGESAYPCLLTHHSNSGTCTTDNLITQEEDILIYNTKTGVDVQFPGEAVIELYATNGVLIDKAQAYQSYSHNLDKGVYIIRVNGRARKFVK